jgi:peptidoglycan/LPS O-acetylase OafA/YrhL
LNLKFIDSLRGWAILAVLFFHCGEFGDNHQLPKKLVSMHYHGAYGVQLFYIISSFTLFYSLIAKRKNENFDWKTYGARRFFRIAPLYYCSIIYYLYQYSIGYGYFLEGNTYTIQNLISNLTFLHGFNPLWINSLVPGGWSVAIEMTFYVIIPILIRHITNFNKAFLFFIISIILRSLLNKILQHNFFNYPSRIWNDFLYFSIFNQLPIFAMGIIVFFILFDKTTVISVNYFYILSFLILLQLLFNIDFFSIHIIYSAVFSILLFSVYHHPIKLIVNNFTAIIGKISFSIYLSHFAILFFLEKYNFINYITTENKTDGLLNFCIRYFVLLCSSITISIITYKLIEKPFRELGNKFVRSK